MSNSFPSQPTGLNLAQVVYSVTFPRPVLGGSLVVDGVATGMGGGLLGVGGLGSITIAFTTPGQAGSFDQTSAETQIAAIITDVCQLGADMSGATLAEVQAGITVNRQWTWMGTGGSTATYNDTMTYPPAAS